MIRSCCGSKLPLPTNSVLKTAHFPSLYSPEVQHPEFLSLLLGAEGGCAVQQCRGRLGAVLLVSEMEGKRWAPDDLFLPTQRRCVLLISVDKKRHLRQTELVHLLPLKWCSSMQLFQTVP